MKKLLHILLLMLVLRSLPGAAQTAPIPDPGFLQCLKDHASSAVNASNQLIISQAATITTLGCVATYNISNLDGLQYFTNLVTLDLDDNLITDANQISGLTKLQTIRLENNFLTTLPNLSALTSLKTLVVYDNFLTTPPNLTNNTQLQYLDLENSKLTTLPDLSGLTSLTTLRLRNNYLSFEDLDPIKSNAGLSINPQKKIPMPASTLDVYVGDQLTLTTGLDHTLSGVTYKWYQNGSLITTTTNDTLSIASVDVSNAGKYSVVLSHPSFSFTINTDTVQVNVFTCPTFVANYKAGNINCIETGDLHITSVSPAAPGITSFTYELRSPVTGEVFTSNSYFSGLNQPEYILTIKTNKVCKNDTIVKMPFEECKEVFITPDGDGDKDSHFFTSTGTATIYDKNGNAVKVLSLPGTWDGSSISGQLVSPGYYSADINKGEKHINISVLY